MLSRKAALYMRVSTEEQAKEGFSIEAQKRILEAQAIVNGYNAVELYADEGKSGKNLRRPQIQRLMEACRHREVAAVIVWRLDRLSRSLRDTLTLIEDIFSANQVALISATESLDTSTPAGRLMINILASFAQNEREVNQQRVCMVMQDLAKQCRHLGGIPPFGYRIADGYYQLDPQTAPAVKHLFDMFIQGHGYTAMLAYLNDNGYKTARGKSFGKNSLYDILSNEKYTGTYIYNRAAAAGIDGRRNNHQNKPESAIIRIPGGIPAIISLATWEKATAIREENKRRPATYRAKQTYLLSGICYCEQCNAKMIIRSGSKDRNGTPQRYYACPNKCVTAARKEHIENAVFDILKAYLAHTEIIKQAVQLASRIISSGEASAKIASLEEKINALNMRTRSLLNALEQAGGPAPLLEDRRNHFAAVITGGSSFVKMPAPGFGRDGDITAAFPDPAFTILRRAGIVSVPEMPDGSAAEVFRDHLGPLLPGDAGQFDFHTEVLILNGDHGDFSFRSRGSY